MRSGWSAKALHRLIVTSSVYRQSSAPSPEAARIDPDNRLLARFPLRRLDAEAIRDAMLAVTGELDDRQGGPYVPTDRTESGEVVVDESVAGATRRSVYLQQRRTEITSLLEVFDAPSIVTTCTRRLPSTIPLQSLSLMNSDFVVARAKARPAARSRVQRCVRRRPSRCSDARITRAFLLTIGRRQTRMSSTPPGASSKPSRPAIPAWPSQMPVTAPWLISARCCWPATHSSILNECTMMIPYRPMDQSPFPLNRRAFLGRYAGAIGTLALSHLLEQEQHPRGGAHAPAEPPRQVMVKANGPGPAPSR